MLAIENVLNPEEVADFRRKLEGASWVDGRATAGYRSGEVKRNLQVATDDEAGRNLGARIVERLSRNALFVTAALPQRIFPPLFNRYEAGMGFGNHIDNALRGDAERIRTDLSATLFLSSPDEYDGGELVVEDYLGTHSVKLAAGDMILYPGSSVHRVHAVTRGTRIAAFFWIQSLVRDAQRRRILLDLDLAIQGLRARSGEGPELLSLSGVYHNLLREWAEP